LLKCNKAKTLSVMRAMLLAFAFLVIASRAALGEVPTYELFLIAPDQIIKTTVTTHGDWDTLEVTVSKPTAAALLAFSERNLGKPACIALLRPNKFLHDDAIVLTPAFVKAPIRNGIVHLTLPNHAALTRGLLAN
jgi:hypothetical protein